MTAAAPTVPITDPAIIAKLTEWNTKVTEIAQHAHLINEERVLRAELFRMLFPTPKEGTNTAFLPMDWQVKGVMKIDRKVDVAAVEAMKTAVRALGVNPDPAIKYVPEVDIKAYRALPAEAMKVFDTALTIKPGLPSIELVPPKPKG